MPKVDESRLKKMGVEIKTNWGSLGAMTRIIRKENPGGRPVTNKLLILTW